MTKAENARMVAKAKAEVREATERAGHALADALNNGETTVTLDAMTLGLVIAGACTAVGVKAVIEFEQVLA